MGTNGLRIAREQGYLRRLADAGVRTLYLQFDGLDDEVYRITRGKPLLQDKLKVIEEARLARDISGDSSC